MWKNVLIVVLLGLFAVEVFFFGFLGRIGTREVVIVLLIAGTVLGARAIKQAARRL
jgi:hypothetical protein